MKAYLLIILSIVFLLNEATAEDEIRWLKLRQELGLEYIINAVFAPGDSTILVTDATFKVVEINANTGEFVRTLPNFWGIIQFSEDQQFVYTYGWQKVKWPSGEIIGKYPVPKSGFSKQIYMDYNAGFRINERAGLLVGVVDQSDYNPAVWKKGIWIFDLNTYRLIDTLGFEKNYYYSTDMLDDGKYFKTSSEYVPDWEHPEYNDQILNIWDTKTLDTISYKNPFNKIGFGMKFRTSPDGKWLCGVGGRSVKVFDNQTYELKYQWEVVPEVCCLNAIDISLDSRYLVTSGNITGLSDKHKELANVRIWDLLSGQLVYKYNNGFDMIGQNYLRFNFSGDKIMGYGPGAIIMYNNMLSPNTDVPESAEPVIYPNPTDGILLINSKYFQIGQLNIELLDMNGRLLGVLYNGFYKQEELKLDISYVNDGIFLIRAIQGKDIKTFKVIKGK